MAADAYDKLHAFSDVVDAWRWYLVGRFASAFTVDITALPWLSSVHQVAMSIYTIPNRCWMAVASLGLLMFIGFGCGPSEFQKHLYQRMDDTRKKHTAAGIQAALVPFFSDEHMLVNPLPIEITSLPIFADDPVDIRITSITTNNSVLMVSTGGGFGHWGIVVARPGHDSEISPWHRKRLTPWEDGVYFYNGE